MSMRLGLFFAIPALLCAQPPRGPRPWWDREVSRELSLTEAQTKQIHQTQKDFRPRMQELRTDVNKAETEMDALFNEDPIDQAKANEAINRLAAARAELTKAVSQMELKLRMILTAQQWADLKEIQRRSWPGGPGQGRHGPRGSSAPTGALNQPK